MLDTLSKRASKHRRGIEARRTHQAGFILVRKGLWKAMNEGLRGALTAMSQNMTSARRKEQSMGRLRRVVGSIIHEKLAQGFMALYKNMRQDQARDAALRMLRATLARLRTGCVGRAVQNLQAHMMTMRYQADVTRLKEEAHSMLRRHSAAHVLSLEV